jgi:hypothetical protein
MMSLLKLEQFSLHKACLVNGLVPAAVEFGHQRVVTDEYPRLQQGGCNGEVVLGERHTF